MVQILVFGDSIAYGIWDKKGGWVQRLREFLDEKTLSDSELKHIIYNLAVSGATTEDLLERFKFEMKQRIGEEETISIFAIGINDSQFLHNKRRFRILPEESRENLQRLIDLAKKFSSKIVFVGITPVDESKTTSIPWNTNKSYKNDYIKKYNEIIKSVCEKNKVCFIEIFGDWITLDYKNLLKDGLHPNSDGHKKIFETVKSFFLIKSKII